MAAEINILNDDAIRQAYIITFFDNPIHTTVTADADTVTRWINGIERPSLYIAGLSIHYRPCEYAHELAATSLELCVGGRCLIYQLDLVDGKNHPQALVDFLGSGDYTFAAMIPPPLRRVLEEPHGLNIPQKYVVELEVLTSRRYNGQRDSGEFLYAGLRKLGEMVLEKELVDLPEIPTLSFWDIRRLTSEEVKVASVEVFVSFEIGRVLDARECMLRYLDFEIV